MKIYYLSATGNSLTAARSLARELDEDVTLVSFRSIRLLPEIETEDTAVGFIFPVYFADVPQEFLACIRKMKFRQNTYLFAIATCNGVPGTTLRTLSGALEQKGAHLSAAFSLDMPGNALITPQAASDKRLNEFPGRLSQIARMIAHREQTSFPGIPVREALRSAAVARHRPPFCGESPKISHSGDGLRWLRPLRAGLPGFEHHHLQQSPPMGFQLHTLSGLFPLVSQTGDTHRRLTLGPSQIPSP